MMSPKAKKEIVAITIAMTTLFVGIFVLAVGLTMMSTLKDQNSILVQALLIVYIIGTVAGCFFVGKKIYRAYERRFDKRQGKEASVRKPVPPSRPKPIIKKASEVTARHLNKNKITALSTPGEKLEAILSSVESMTFNASNNNRDVQMGLATIKMNCHEAISAIKNGIDDIGNPITTQEVGKGLRLLWVNFAVGWIDIVKSKIGTTEHKKLTDILEQIKDIAKALEN